MSQREAPLYPHLLLLVHPLPLLNSEGFMMVIRMMRDYLGRQETLILLAKEAIQAVLSHAAMMKVAQELDLAPVVGWTT